MKGAKKRGRSLGGKREEEREKGSVRAFKNQTLPMKRQPDVGVRVYRRKGKNIWSFRRKKRKGNS